VFDEVAVGGTDGGDRGQDGRFEFQAFHSGAVVLGGSAPLDPDGQGEGGELRLEPAGILAGLGQETSGGGAGDVGVEGAGEPSAVPVEETAQRRLDGGDDRAFVVRIEELAEVGIEVGPPRPEGGGNLAVLGRQQRPGFAPPGSPARRSR
jgi:hypothetical protein